MTAFYICNNSFYRHWLLLLFHLSELLA
jgi:hypothetical protein